MSIPTETQAVDLKNNALAFTLLNFSLNMIRDFDFWKKGVHKSGLRRGLYTLALPSYFFTNYKSRCLKKIELLDLSRCVLLRYLSSTNLAT